MTTTRAEAEKAARDLLTATWGPTNGNAADHLPVDPFQIARRLGITVAALRLGPDVAGMTGKKVDRDPEIYLNADDSLTLQRFNCALELGYYVKRASSDDDASWAHIDERGSTAVRGPDPAKTYADQFAAELLMPDRLVRKLANELGAAGLAVTFAVPIETMKQRLQSLGLT